MHQLAGDFLRDYRINKRKSIKKRAERSVDAPTTFFEGYSVPEITTLKIRGYIEKRMEDDAANATTNKERAALKRMLNLGGTNHLPCWIACHIFPCLRKTTPERDFEHAEYLALREALPNYLKDFIAFAYKTGWRISEITTLTWNQADRKQGIVRPKVGETKNDEARTIYLNSEIKSIFDKL